MLSGLLRGSYRWVPPLASERPHTSRAQFERARRVPRQRERGWDRALFDEQLFRDVLQRERSRADRFEESFHLLTVKGVDSPMALPAWAEITERLTRAKGRTDLVGWMAKGSALGLVVTGGTLDDLARARSLERCVRQHLVANVRPAGEWSVSVETCNGSTPASFAPCSESAPRRYLAMKRSLDIAGSLFLLLLFAPVFLLVAILVKATSRGPIIFKQVRIGQSARPFTMFKFRTMRADADYALHQEYVTTFITSTNAVTAGTKTPLFKIADDPRVTPIGHSLRRFSLDELPQFWNVLRGDMSLVGPRPPLHYEVDRYKPWHLRRVLEAKPGVTGLWQVTGRSRTTFDDMVRLDLRYARSRSIWMDIKILLATPRAVVTGKGAC